MEYKEFWSYRFWAVVTNANSNGSLLLVYLMSGMDLCDNENVCNWGRETVNIIQKVLTRVSLKFNSFMTEPLSYRNQSIDLLRKSMNWFLCDNGLRHERVKSYVITKWGTVG